MANRHWAWPWLVWRRRGRISAFLLSALPGRGPGPHRHPYGEVQFIRSGRGLYQVNGQEFEAGAGDIPVIKAGEIYLG